MKQEIINKLLELALKDDASHASSEKVAFEVGGKYLFRTVTYFATGRVKDIIGDFLILEDAAWVADTGRFQQAIMEGTLNEVEPVDVLMRINLNAIVDAFDWKHELPRKQK